MIYVQNSVKDTGQTEKLKQINSSFWIFEVYIPAKGNIYK